MDNSLIIDVDGKSEINIDEWVVVKVPGVGYLGKIRGIAMSKVAASSKDDRIKDFKKKAYAVMKENDGWLELSVAYDYSAPMMPMQDRDGRRFFNREPVIVPAEFTTHPIPVSVKPSGLIFIADMHKDDQATYKKFIDSVEGTMTRLRTQQAGIHMPGATNG